MPIHEKSEIQVTSLQIPKWHCIPNTSIQSKPLMIYHGAFEATVTELKAHLEEVGEVIPADIAPNWIQALYTQDHFHSKMNSVLGVVSGRSRACFGGEENPNRFETIVKPGDLIIIPAGVSHRIITDQDIREEGFEAIWAYPLIVSYDICHGQPGEEEKVKDIQNVAWFHRDPLYGDDGPALHV